MWRYFSRDYPEDAQMVKDRVEPGYGIVGCEMHERNGWGETARGDHTCPLAHRYLQCPKCGYINESRKDFALVDGERILQLRCSRCSHDFTVTKSQRRSLGKPQPWQQE